MAITHERRNSLRRNDPSLELVVMADGTRVLVHRVTRTALQFRRALLVLVVAVLALTFMYVAVHPGSSSVQRQYTFAPVQPE